MMQIMAIWYGAKPEIMPEEYTWCASASNRYSTHRKNNKKLIPNTVPMNESTVMEGL